MPKEEHVTTGTVRQIRLCLQAMSERQTLPLLQAYFCKSNCPTLIKLHGLLPQGPHQPV